MEEEEYEEKRKVKEVMGVAHVVVMGVVAATVHAAQQVPHATCARKLRWVG